MERTRKSKEMKDIFNLIPDQNVLEKYGYESTKRYRDIKTEQHKVIAEAMGLKLKHNVISGYYKDVETIEYPWNPETIAEQTLMVLKWLIKEASLSDEGLKTWYNFLDKIKYIFESVSQDFQTAVCMAAFEYAENLKKKT
jgi:hypothetical protein